MRTTEGAQFIQSIQDGEAVMNCISVLISPELHRIGTQATNMLKHGQWLKNKHPNINLWTSIYSGIEVIVNRVTPVHRDSEAAPSMYDLLVSAGTHQQAWMDLPDVKARLTYEPCTVVAISGKVLRHGVDSWVGGERICIAHFIRDNVHNRLKLPRPDWVKNTLYLDLMDDGFVDRHAWLK